MDVVLSNLSDSLLYLQDQNYVFNLFFEEKFNKCVYSHEPTHTNTHQSW